MFQRVAVTAHLFAADLRRRLDTLREEPEAGSVVDTVITIAVLAILAIAVMGLIAAKVTAKAQSINLGN
jgi:hypothetical protein